MNIKTGAGIAAAGLLLAGCSNGAPTAAPAAAAPAPTSASDAHSRGVEIVQTVMPGASVSQAEEIMQSTCDLVQGRPTADGILGVRARLVERGLGSTTEVTALIAASVAGTCPEYLPVLPHA